MNFPKNQDVGDDRSGLRELTHEESLQVSGGVIPVLVVAVVVARVVISATASRLTLAYAGYEVGKAVQKLSNTVNQNN